MRQIVAKPAFVHSAIKMTADQYDGCLATFALAAFAVEDDVEKVSAALAYIKENDELIDGLIAADPDPDTILARFLDVLINKGSN